MTAAPCMDEGLCSKHTKMAHFQPCLLDCAYIKDLPDSYCSIVMCCTHWSLKVLG